MLVIVALNSPCLAHVHLLYAVTFAATTGTAGVRPLATARVRALTAHYTAAFAVSIGTAGVRPLALR